MTQYIKIGDSVKISEVHSDNFKEDLEGVYRRQNGNLYQKLNNICQLKVKLSDGVYVGDGCAEGLDPDEMVTIVA